MKAKSKEFAPVSEIIGGVRLPKSVKEHLKNHEIWSKWAEIVGPELSRVTSPAEMKTKVLEVHVAHQAWAQQLHFLKPSIIGKIRSVCPSSRVLDLQFRVGKVTPSPLPSKKDSLFFGKKDTPVQLSERMEMTLRAVEDPDLRATIRKAMEASVRRFS